MKDKDLSAKMSLKMRFTHKAWILASLNPRSRTWSGCSRVECLRPLEMERMRFSTRRFVWPRERAIGEVEIFIELS
jgi:hypothetical protein